MKFENWEGVDLESTTEPTLEDLYGVVSDEKIEPIVEEAPIVEKKKSVQKVTGEQQQQEEEKEIKEPSLEELYDGVEKEEEEQENKTLDTKALLKATALYKAEKYGLDVSEVEEWNEEAFAALEDEIDNIRLEERWEQAKDSNDAIRDVLRIAEAGGDMRDILSLLQEQQDLADIDTSSPEGMKEYIKKYYTNVKGEDVDWVNRYLKGLGVSDDPEALQEEFESTKQKYDNVFKQEKEARIKASEDASKQQALIAKKRKDDFSEVLNKNVTKKTEARELQDFVFQEKYQIRGTNQVISEFDKSLREIKKDPNGLFELALFLKDKEAFKQRVITQVNNVKNENKFASILKNQTETTVVTEQPKEKRKFKLQLE